MVLGGEAYFPRPIPPRGETYAQIARSSPANGSAAMYTTFLLALSGARRSVLVTNPYFVLDDTMREALLNTVRRGVRVSVLVPGTIDHNLVRQASRAQFGPLLKAGVEIYEYTPALLHAKTMVIDDVWATVGSTNLDNLSFAFNDEMNLIVYNRAFARELARVFASDIAASKRITLDDWKDRGFKARFLEVLAFPIRDVL
jgi:cardiolipin synthase